MKKKVINIILGFMLLILLIVSVCANFHRPKFSSKSVKLTVNVNDKIAQPIFIDKSSGVTKAITAKFELDTTHIKNCELDTINLNNLEINSAYIKKIELSTIRLSGLIDHGFEQAILVNGKFYILMSLFGKESIDVIIPNDLLKISTSYAGDWSAEVRYLGLLDSFKFCVNADGDLDFECFKSFVTEDGRICNINCVHE